MQLTQWNTAQITQFNQQSEQVLLRDGQTLVFFDHDFGKLVQSRPEAVYQPENTREIQTLLSYASKQRLPVTIRGNGLSQNGQSLPVSGGVVLSMEKLNSVIELEDECIWVEANASFADLLKVSLSKGKIPPVLPYNCNLSVGGVLSAGGVGASSFRHGAINAHVKKLEVIDGTGNLHQVDSNSSLFHACLGGQGQFGVITKAAIELRNAGKNVKTWCFVYADHQSFMADIEKLRESVDYLELFCSPSIQGMKLTGHGRVPMTQWLYGLHASKEFDTEEPGITTEIKPWKTLHVQQESMESWVFRHNPRFESMKKSGQWDMIHPWYECFVPTKILHDHLTDLLERLPVYYATMVQIVPIANKKAGFLQLPDSDSISAFMILNAGVSESLKEGCLKAMKDLDDFFLSSGGKRYLSGYQGQVRADHWQTHFGSQFENWIKMKKQWDPSGVLGSYGVSI